MLRRIVWLGLWLALVPTGTLHAQKSEGGELIRGTVFGPDGLPAASVEVWINQELVSSDSEGSFEHLASCDATTETATCTVEIRVEGGAQRVTPPAEIIINLGEIVVFDVEASTSPEPITEVAAEEPALAEVKIFGTIRTEDGRPISDVRVFIRSGAEEVRSNKNGEFELMLLPGENTLAFVHPDFSSQEQAVMAEDGARVEVVLTPASVALDDFTISAPRIEGSTVDLLAERKDSDAVTEVIGAEEMSKSGASTAADAVFRVTGITVVGGKYVYVRGLGDRYSSTLLNGATLPSPEPEKRVVPLDLFPTDLLESVVIQKSYSPNMPGEFGGGVVELRTREFPEEFQAEISLSMGVNASTTFRDGLSSPGGAWDWLGFDDGLRRMPEELEAASKDQPLKEGDLFGSGGYTKDELERFGELVPNSWELRNRANLPAIGVQGSIGDSAKIFGKKSGWRLGLTYDRDTDHEVRRETYYIVGAGGALESSNSYEFTTTNDNVVLGGILTTGIEFDSKNRLVLTSVIDRVSDNENRVYEGFNRDVDSTIRVTRYQWIERQLLFNQIKGEHGFWGLELDWHYVFAQARRLEPDRRETRYDLRPTGDFQLSDRPEGNSRVYSALVDNSHDAALSLEKALNFGVIKPVVSTGIAGTLKAREVDTRRFKYFGDSLNPDALRLEPQDLFVPENIGDGGFTFLEITRPTDNYRADQEVAAAWVDTKWPVLVWLEFGAGARLEYSSQRVETFELFNASAAPVSAELNTMDVLPATYATATLNSEMKARLTGSRTVSRPDFRELSPMLFNDVTGGIAVQGNPELDRGLITHLDARWEWYPSAAESVSAGVFYKYFERPIESVLIPGAQQLKTFANAEGAQNLGVEVEARKSLEFLGALMRDFYVAGNISLINSRIEIDPASGIQTSSERPLQGQSPWVVNAQVGWDAVESGTSITLLFNAVGARIAEVGAQGAPDIYEEAVPRLELVARQKLGDTLKLGFKATNLIDPEIRYTQGDRLVSSLRTGRKFSVSIGADF